MSREQAEALRDETANRLGERWQRGELQTQAHCIWCSRAIPRSPEEHPPVWRLYDRWSCKEEAKAARKRHRERQAAQHHNAPTPTLIPPTA